MQLNRHLNKIKDNFEKLKSQKALANVLEKHLGINKTKEIEKLLQYKVSNIQQLEILHNGLVQKK